MLTINKSYRQTIKYLFIRSIKIKNRELYNKIINGIIWSTLNIVIFAFIMPKIGISQTFGIFIVATMPPSNSYLTAMNSVYAILTDIANEESSLTYELILPIPQWIIFATYAIEIAYQALATSILVLPLGKLILGSNLKLEFISCIKFYFILTISSLFFGFFAIFIASLGKNLHSELDNIWMRFIFPMWFLGGAQFSWQNLYCASPTFAYINLLNPVVYALEGARSVILNPQLSLPYWKCVLALLFFTIIFGYRGIHNLKKRMDCL